MGRAIVPRNILVDQSAEHRVYCLGNIVNVKLARGYNLAERFNAGAVEERHIGSQVNIGIRSDHAGALYQLCKGIIPAPRGIRPRVKGYMIPKEKHLKVNKGIRIVQRIAFLEYIFELY